MTADNPRPITYASELARRHRGHFFDADTLRAFGSRIDDEVMPAAGGARSYFVTSERDRYGSAWGGVRRYTVRAIDWRTGSIDEPDGEEFGAYARLDTARKAARKYAHADTVGEFAYPCPLHGTRYAAEISAAAGLCFACCEAAYEAESPSPEQVIAQARARLAGAA